MNRKAGLEKFKTGLFPLRVNVSKTEQYEFFVVVNMLNPRQNETLDSMHQSKYYLELAETTLQLMMN